MNTVIPRCGRIILPGDAVAGRHVQRPSLIYFGRSSAHAQKEAVFGQRHLISTATRARLLTFESRRRSAFTISGRITGTSLGIFWVPDNSNRVNTYCREVRPCVTDVRLLLMISRGIAPSYTYRVPIGQ